MAPKTLVRDDGAAGDVSHAKEGCLGDNITGDKGLEVHELELMTPESCDLVEHEVAKEKRPAEAIPVAPSKAYSSFSDRKKWLIVTLAAIGSVCS